MRDRWMILVGLALVCAAGLAPAATDPISRARTLHRAVHEGLDDASLVARTRAVEQLHEAIDLDPQGLAGDHWQLLGYVRELGRFDHEAELCYRNAAVIAPNDREVWLGLGRVLKRQYLRTLDADELHAAIAELDTATRCYPPSTEPWIALVPLLVESGDLPRALAAANRSLGGHPALPEGLVAAGMMAYRTGDIERADSLFHAALPKLAAVTREVYDHPERYVGKLAPRKPAPPPNAAPPPPAAHGSLSGSAEPGDEAPLAPAPAAPAPAALDPAAAPVVPLRGWRSPAEVLPDPDPTTPQNEMALEYWSRVTQAYLLFNDPLRPGLDARAETFLRYGPPARVVYNPLGYDLTFRPNPNGPSGMTNNAPRGASMTEFPLHAQLWMYPELNMRILLHDRSLLGNWTIPAVREPLPNSEPDPAVLSKRNDLLGIEGGFAVFPTLPPREQRIDVSLALFAFDGGAFTRLAAFAGAEGESLRARWLVTDAAGRTVARSTHALGRSLCGPGRSAGEYDVGLPPGRYAVVVSVTGPRGRRGLARDSLVVAAPDRDLAMSDLVASCGSPATLVDRDAVRLEPLAGDPVRGSAPLAVYFEISRLATGDDGLSRYTFGWAVERLATDARGRRTGGVSGVSTWASREEVFKGTLRRQFVSVPVARLAPGRYRLNVTVHDTISGLSEARTLEFERR